MAGVFLSPQKTRPTRTTWRSLRRRRVRDEGSTVHGRRGTRSAGATTREKSWKFRNAAPPTTRATTRGSRGRQPGLGGSEERYIKMRVNGWRTARPCRGYKRSRWPEKLRVPFFPSFFLPLLSRTRHNDCLAALKYIHIYYIYIYKYVRIAEKILRIKYYTRVARKHPPWYILYNNIETTGQKKIFFHIGFVWNVNFFVSSLWILRAFFSIFLYLQTYDFRNDVLRLALYHAYTGWQSSIITIYQAKPLPVGGCKKALGLTIIF